MDNSGNAVPLCTSSAFLWGAAFSSKMMMATLTAYGTNKT